MLDDAKRVNTPEGWDVIKGDLDKLKKWEPYAVQQGQLHGPAHGAGQSPVSVQAGE